jgi:hypothetical protein
MLAPGQFLKPLDQPLPLETGQPLDPKHSVELIDLMLVADRTKALRFLGLRIALDIVVADPDPRMGVMSSLIPGIETLPS